MSRYNPPRSVPLPGYVYILTCPSFPGCCKIGGTGRTARHRAGELVGEYVTGQPFTVSYQSKPVSDWPAAETGRASHVVGLPVCRVPSCSGAARARPRAVVKAVARAQARPWLGWLSPRPRRSPGRQWRRYRRDDSGAALVLAVLAVAMLLAWIKPPVPSWLPPSSARALVWLERF